MVLWVEGAVWMLLFLLGNELAFPLNGSDPSGCGLREYGHSCSSTPQANGPATIFAGSDQGGSNKIVTNPEKIRAASNQVNFGQKNEHHWHYPPSVIRLRGIGSSVLHSGSRKNKEYPVTLKNKDVPCIACRSTMQLRSLLTGDPSSVVNHGHRGNFFGSFGSEDRGIISGSMLRSIVRSTIHLGSADNRPGHGVNSQEHIVIAYSRSDGNDNLASSTISPPTIDFGSAHSETGHSADSQGHRSTLLSQSGRNVVDDKDRIHALTILFGSGHSVIPPRVNDAEHGRNAYSLSESGQTSREQKHFDQNNLASNEISPPSTHFESPHDGIAPILDTTVHGGNAHSESGSRQSVNEGNHHNHEKLAPSDIIRPTIFLEFHFSGIGPGVGNSDNDGNQHTQYSQNSNDNSSSNQAAINDSAVHFDSGHGVDNLGHRGNAYSLSSGNTYDHSSSLPSAMSPPTISFGSAHSGVAPSTENAEHGRNAVSEPAESASAQGQGENAYNRSDTFENDHNNLDFGEISPPTIYLRSEDEEHGNAHSQYGSRPTKHERNRDDHNNFAPNEANPPSIQFGSGYTIYPSEDNRVHGETAYGLSGTDSNGDRSVGPSAIRPPPIFFGSTHSGFAPSVENAEQSGSAHTHSGSRQSTLERNHYEPNIPALPEIHRPTIHFGSGREGVAPDVDRAEQSENVHSQSGSDQSASEENYNNQNNLASSEFSPPTTNTESTHSGIPLSVDYSEHRDNNSVTHSHGGGHSTTPIVADHDNLGSSSVHYEPSKIIPVVIDFGDSDSLITQHLSGLSDVESHPENFASNQNRNDADPSDQDIFVPSAVSHQQLGSLHHPLESEQGSHTPGNIVSEVDKPPPLYFGSGSNGVSPSADNQIYSEIDHSETTGDEDNSVLSAGGSRVYEVISVAPTFAGEFVSSRLKFYDRISRSSAFRPAGFP